MGGGSGSLGRHLFHLGGIPTVPSLLPPIAGEPTQGEKPNPKGIECLPTKEEPSPKGHQTRHTNFTSNLLKTFTHYGHELFVLLIKPDF